MGLYSGGLIIGRIFAPEIWGAYFREGLVFFFLFFGGGAHYQNFTVFLAKMVKITIYPTPKQNGTHL